MEEAPAAREVALVQRAEPPPEGAVRPAPKPSKRKPARIPGQKLTREEIQALLATSAAASAARGGPWWIARVLAVPTLAGVIYFRSFVPAVVLVLLVAACLVAFFYEVRRLW